MCAALLCHFRGSVGVNNSNPSLKEQYNTGDSSIPRHSGKGCCRGGSSGESSTGDCAGRRQGSSGTPWPALEETWASADSAGTACQNKVMSGSALPCLPFSSTERTDQICVAPRLIFLLPRFLQQLALTAMWSRCNGAYPGIYIKEEMVIWFHLIWATWANLTILWRCTAPYLRIELHSGGMGGRNLPLEIIKETQESFLIYVLGIIQD